MKDILLLDVCPLSMVSCAVHVWSFSCPVWSFSCTCLEFQLPSLEFQLPSLESQLPSCLCQNNMHHQHAAVSRRLPAGWCRLYRLPCDAGQLRAASHAWPPMASHGLPWPPMACLVCRACCLTTGPHTLTVTLQGIETVGGVMTKLINRNTVIPTKKSQVGAGE